MAERPMVLVTTPLGSERRAPLLAEFDLTFELDRRRGVRALVVDGVFQVPAGILATFPDLEIIACIGTGYESIDLDACARRGIAVTNTAGANADAVADLTLGLILNLTRGIGEAERLLRAGLWRGDQPNRFFDAPGLTDRRVAIFGMGAIGRKIAQRLSGFDVRIAYGGPSQKVDLPYPYVADLKALALWSDILVLAHRADESNRGIVDARVLRALGATGHLINVSRGSAIAEEALIAALRDGTIAGAALDVFDTEPNIPSDLLDQSATVLTPHIGGGSSQSFDRMFVALAANLRAFFNGSPLPNPVLDRPTFQVP